MDVNSANQAGAAVGAMVKALQTQSLQGALIDKTFKAMSEIQNTQAQSGPDIQKTVSQSSGKGLNIDALV